MHVTSLFLDFQRHLSWFFSMFNELRREAVVGSVWYWWRLIFLLIVQFFFGGGGLFVCFCFCLLLGGGGVAEHL